MAIVDFRHSLDPKSVKPRPEISALEWLAEAALRTLAGIKTKAHCGRSWPIPPELLDGRVDVWKVCSSGETARARRAANLRIRAESTTALDTTAIEI